MTINNKLFQAKIGGTKENGSTVDLDLEDVLEQLIKDVIVDLAKTIEPNIFSELITLLNSIIVSDKVEIGHAISILNAENCLDQGKWYALIRHLPEKLATETIEFRISLIFKILKKPRSCFLSHKNINAILRTVFESPKGPAIKVLRDAE